MRLPAQADHPLAQGGAQFGFGGELHRRIDLMTAELIARYREQPLLALQILPDDPLTRRSSV